MTQTIIIHPGGRPKEGLDSLPNNWKDQIVFMYAQGCSDAEVMATIYMWRGSFSKSLWYRWLSEFEEFSEVIQVGRIIAEAWWSKVGRENLQNPKFQVVNYIWNTRNRFGWNDKGEQKTMESGSDSNVDVTQLSFETIKELLKAKKDAAKS